MKITILITIATFWLLLPIPLMFFGIGGNDISTLKEDMENVSEIDDSYTSFLGIEIIWNYFKVFVSFLVMYFKIIFLWVDGIPIIFNYFFWFLRLSSFIALVVLMKE